MHNNLGVARLRLGKWNEAGTEFDRASALDPEEADYLINIAIAKIIGKQAAAAVAPLEHARKIRSRRQGSESAADCDTGIAWAKPGSGGDSRRGDGQPPIRRRAPNLQDGNGLARLARVSRTLDRTLLRPGGEAPEGQPAAGKGPRKIDSGGEHR